MILENMDEKALIKRAQEGDLDAFTKIEKASRHKIKKSIGKYSSGAYDTEEIYQTTMVKTWLKIGSFKNDSLFSTWAIRIAINLIKDKYRQAKLRRMIPIEDLGVRGRDGSTTPSEKGFLDLYGRGPDQRSQISKNMEADDLRRKLNKVLKAIPEQHRKILLLHSIEEMDYKQIAKKLEIPIGTVMSRLFYARKYAKRLLEGVRDQE